MKQTIDFLKGKKTYIVGIAAIIYGVYVKNMDAVLLGLGLIGVRDGISTEIARAFLSKKK